MDFFDIFQQYRIEKSSRDAKQSVFEAKRKSSDNEISIRTLEAKIDHLSLVCMAMGELLEEVGFSKKMLLNKIEEIDLRDGKLDGKLAPSNKCQSCSRKVAARHVSCLYCGTKIENNTIL